MEAAARECEAVAHLPAWHGIRLRHRSRRDFWELNVDRALNAFEAAKRVEGLDVLMFRFGMFVPADFFQKCSLCAPSAFSVSPR
jgi:nucleoside-diphosphate-sugar epimerase